VTSTALVTGCQKALVRAYEVANYLRAGQALLARSPLFTAAGQLTPAASAEQARKASQREDLDWIAVSGEDDQPARPVNVPSSDFPQFDLDVDVEAPFARPPNATRVRVSTRYVIAQALAPAPIGRTRPMKPASGHRLRAEAVPSLAPDAEIILFIHGMDSRAEEANDLTRELHKLAAADGRNVTVISVDLPTSGYAENLDYERVSPLADIGVPGWTFPSLFPLIVPSPFSELLSLVPGVALYTPPGAPMVVPPGTTLPDFTATGRTPLLDFIETFIVRFVDTLDRQIPIKDRIRAVVGGSLGGNMAFRLGRRADVPWLPAVIAWSPASIWDSLGDGADLFKHIAPRSGWSSANDARESPSATDRQKFFGSWDKAIVPVLIQDAQSDTWHSEFYPCKKSSIAGARLDRHETYDGRFLAWRWRLGAEQLLYSHQSNDPATGLPRFMSNFKRMLLACGTEDDVLFNEICDATQETAPLMTRTPGKALVLEQTGHSIDNERPTFWAGEVSDFLGL
jgi:hypothetical protein